MNLYRVYNLSSGPQEKDRSVSDNSSKTSKQSETAMPQAGDIILGRYRLKRKILEDKLSHIKTPLSLSIIGCVVNGPGEAAQTDIGITGGGKGNNMLYLNGIETEKIITDEIISKYDWFVFTRSDFYWKNPHPLVSLLSSDHMYIQDSEYHGGVPDRHFIVPQQMVGQYIQLSSPIFRDPGGLIDRVKSSDSPPLNIEAYLKFRLQELGLLSSVIALPQLGFLVRTPGEDSRHSMGELHRGLGLFVKYIAEFRASSYTSDLITHSSDWKSFISPMTRTIAPRISLCGSLTLPFHSNEMLWRPGRLSRELRRYKPAHTLLICIGLLLQLFERGFRRLLLRVS